MKKNSVFDNPNISHTCLVNFQFIYENLKSAERKAADFCLEHPQSIADLTITEVAVQVGCSEATLVRLAKRLGYAGYPELRSKILRSEHENASHFIGISPSDSIPTMVNSVFRSCMLYIQDSLQAIDFGRFEQALSLLSQAKRLVFAAAGDAYFTAASGAQKFLRIGYPVSVSTDFDTQLVSLSQLTSDDVMICISHSGRTKDVCELAKIAKDNGIKVIAITNFPVSPLAKNSDVVLLTASFAYDTMDEILVKRVPALCLLDALYICIRMKQPPADDGFSERANRFLAMNKL